MTTRTLLTDEATARPRVTARRAGTILAAAASAALALLLSGSVAVADDAPMGATASPTTAPSVTDAAAAPTTAPVTSTSAAPMTDTAAPATQPAMPAVQTGGPSSANVMPVADTSNPASTESGTMPSAGTMPSSGIMLSGLGSDGTLDLMAGHSMVLGSNVSLKKINVLAPDVADVTPLSPTSVLVTAKHPGTTQLILSDDNDRARVVNVTVGIDLSAVRQSIHSAFPHLRVMAAALNDTIALSGQVPDLQTAEQVMEMAGTYGKVHNFMEVSGGQQVMLQVRFAEVSKTAIRNLGVNFGGTDGTSAFTTTGFGGGSNVFNLAAGSTSLLTGTNTAANIFGFGQFGGTPFDYFITCLRQNNLIKILAEPNVMAISGQEASFLAGGQIPVPVPQPGNGGSTITIEYKDYGVELNFKPTVLGQGNIRLKVAPTVSQIDTSTSVSVAGTNVPGFTRRNLETTVELKDGQTLALAGLLNNQLNASVQQIPVLGQLPILGPLFRSTQYARSETELVITVTPRLVAPLNPDEVPALPGEHWRYPNDAQIYAFGDLGGPATKADHVGPPPQFHGTYGFTAAGMGYAAPIAP